MHNRPVADICRKVAARSGTQAGRVVGPSISVRLALLLACLVLSLFLPHIQDAAAAKADRFHRPFSRYANQEPLQAVLLDFAQTQGYSAVVVPGVEGTISGRFDAVPPVQFLNGVRAAFGVSWYTLGNTLYFYPEALSTRMFISPKATQPQEMFTSLRASGVLSPELSAHLAPGGKMIIVYGPPHYLAEVRDAVAAFEETLISNTDMRVFPLRYAWADDITITSMDSTITVPGVASILRAAVTKESTATTQVTERPATVDNLLGSGMIRQGASVESAPRAVVASGAQVGNAYVNIMADPRVNAVLVTDAAYRMPYYEKAIAALDRPVELVEIHAAIVDIDVNFTRELGVSYQGTGSSGRNWSGTGSLSSDGSSFTPLPQPGEISGTGLNLSTIYSFGSDFFIARVRALEEQGEARVLGRPSVLTVDNVQATLENTSTYYIKIEGYQAVDLFKVEAGTVLKVTPHIIKHDGRPDTIKLAVTVQDNQNTDTDSAYVGEIPPVKQTKINTQAMVAEGQSLLIGGYYYEEAKDNDSGVPILMNIPFLGNLFKTTSTDTRRMERLIMITPRVIRLDDLPAVPGRVDERSFHVDPRQADYEYRQPVERPSRSGCSRREASLDPARTSDAGL